MMPWALLLVGKGGKRKDCSIGFGERMWRPIEKAKGGGVREQHGRRSSRRGREGAELPRRRQRAQEERGRTVQ